MCAATSTSLPAPGRSQSSILSDIEGPQWMTQTAAEFNRLTDLLVKHSSTNPALSANEINLVATFLTTFSSSHPSFMQLLKTYVITGSNKCDIFISARTSYSPFRSRPVHPSHAKNPYHLYSLINHCKTTVNLSNHIFCES